MKNFMVRLWVAAACWILVPVQAAQVQVAPARGFTLEVLDTGRAWVTEQRQVSLPPGRHRLVFEDLPASLIAGSAAPLTRGRDPGFSVLSQEYSPVATTRRNWLASLVGKRVRAGGPEGPQGLLREFVLDDSLGAVDLLLDQGKELLWLKSVDQIQLSDTSAPAAQPLIWNVEVGEAAPTSLRMVYQVEGVAWKAVYSLVTEEDSPRASLSARIGVYNHTAHPFENARVLLVQTEEGQTPSLIRGAKPSASRRFSEAASEPVFEQQMAAPDSRLQIQLPNALTLQPRTEVFVSYLELVDIPIRTDLVYDGVLFDRYQRDQRNDWNFGTESHSVVDQYLILDSLGRQGMEQTLPKGSLQVLRRRADGGVTLTGETELTGLDPASGIRIRLGPSKGVSGHRQRIGYTEITPLHEYEETFQITLTNQGDEKAPVRIREHLYRWPTYEIVKADSDYEEGDQQIEFPVNLEPGDVRSVQYTVRYRW